VRYHTNPWENDQKKYILMYVLAPPSLACCLFSSNSSGCVEATKYFWNQTNWRNGFSILEKDEGSKQSELHRSFGGEVKAWVQVKEILIHLFLF
jgi:hypothetical protein